MLNEDYYILIESKKMLCEKIGLNVVAIVFMTCKIQMSQ